MSVQQEGPRERRKGDKTSGKSTKPKKSTSSDEGGKKKRDKGDPGVKPKSARRSHEHSRVAQLWLMSRLETNEGDDSGTPQYRSKGEERPVTWDNLKLASELAGELWRPFLALFWDDHVWIVLGYLLRRMLKGLFPAIRAWSQAKMMDLVQTSFKSNRPPVDPYQVFYTALLSILCAGADDIYRLLAQRSDAATSTMLENIIERSYLHTQMAFSIPSISDPHICAIIHEAGIFAGTTSRVQRKGRGMSGTDPCYVIDNTAWLITVVVQIVSQLLLLIRTITSGSKGTRMSNFVLISLSLASPALRIAGAWLIKPNSGSYSRQLRRAYEEQHSLKDMSMNGTYKQEVLLFTLKEWIIRKWDALKQEQMDCEGKKKDSNRFFKASISIGQHGVQTSLYVLLATGLVRTKKSFGSIQLYQRTATSLLNSLEDFMECLDEAYQTIFYLAAFIEAITDPEGVEMRFRKGRPGDNTSFLDYDDHRQEGGMTIEARDLSFTYPGSSEPVLRGITLSLKAGETLAIVGFNGGGKTTLVKVLMGLFDHQGELLINGQPAKHYLPSTIHRRTSCLFQDFSKYTMTLRENVGVGSVDKIHNLDQIEAAIERGGADVVRKKVGLDGRLDRWGTPERADDGIAKNRTTPKKASSSKTPTSFKKIPSVKEEDAEKTTTPEVAAQEAAKDKDPSSPEAGPTEAADAARDTAAVELKPKVSNQKATEASGRSKKDSSFSLSGGQWQRVALARAFLRSDDADLVVFDEPSASLDPKAEAQLFQRIHALSHGTGRKITTIYISHRFSTVRKADKIAVLEDGTITELGSHGDLMALGGRYAEFFNLQKEGYE